MTYLSLLGIAIVCFAGGFAVALLVARRRAPSSGSPERASAESVPLSASPDMVARGVAALLADRASLRLLAIYAAREGSGALDARWREREAGAQPLPLHAPETLVLQVRGAQLVDAHEIERGLRPGLPPGDPAVVAYQVEAERMAEERKTKASFNENPFELEDHALTDGASPTGPLPGDAPKPLAVDEAAIAARLVAVAWEGPFGWRGLVVAAPPSGSREKSLAWLESVARPLGERLGVHCEAAERARLAASSADAEPAVEPAAATTVFVAGAAPAEEDPAAARVRKADARLADVLLAPRRSADLIRATVGLLADGLAADRCYAVEVDGLHAIPIEHERRTEAAASAVGLDFGVGFLNALRARSAPTITAITLDAASAAEMIPEDARERLGPVSRMLVPVQEKGRFVVVFVAEWIDSAKRWNPADVTFAERAVARAATARERLVRLDVAADQAEHARAEQERAERATAELQAVLAAVPEPLVGLDGDGAITFANRAAADLFARPEFELMGRWIGEAAADLEGDASTWEQVLTTATPRRFPAAFLSKGEPVDVSVVPDVASGVCERLVAFAPRHGEPA